MLSDRPTKQNGRVRLTYVLFVSVSVKTERNAGVHNVTARNIHIHDRSAVDVA